MSLSRRADPIRLVAVRLGQGELKHVTQEPGVHEAVRVSVYYHDDRAPNSVGTVRRSLGDTCELQLAYDKIPEPVYFDLAIPVQRFQSLLLAFRQVHFDQLDDQPDVPYLGVDLWLVERIAGSFYHDIVLCPSLATDAYQSVIDAVTTYLPETIREGVH